MKNNGLTLFRLILWNQYRINEWKEKKSKYRRNSIIMGIAILTCIIVLASYCFGIGFALGSMGIADVIPGYAIMIVGIVTLFFTILKSNGILFGFKDYEMLISLPIKMSTIITSRFFYMYFMNVLFTMVVMIPLGISYYIFERPGSIFFPMWLCGILFAGLIPTTLAAVIGAVIVYIGSHFKYTNVFVTIASFILVIAILSASMFMGSIDENSIDLNQLTKIGEIISKQMNSIYPISSLFQKAIVESCMGALGLFIFISIGWYLIFLIALSTQYKSINTAIMTHSSKSNFKMHELKRSSAVGSLYKKELKRFFSSNVYVLNVGMGAIMAFMMTIAIYVLKPEKLEEILQVPNLDNILIKIIAFVFSGVIAMSCTTSVALSLEGKNLWILKSLPLNTITIMNSKILVNLTIILPIDLIFGVLMNLKFQTDMLTRIMMFVTPIVYSLFVAVWGMFINIKFPNFEWESETAVIKQGMASMLGMLGGAFFAVIPIGIILILQQFPFQVLQLITTIIFGIITALLYKSICKYRI